MKVPTYVSSRRPRGITLLLAIVVVATGAIALAAWATRTGRLLAPGWGAWLGLLGVISTILAIIMFVDGDEATSGPRDTAAIAAFIAVAPILSLVLAFLTVALYISGMPAQQALMAGLAITLVLWVILAILSQRSITVAHVRPDSYNELRERCESLGAYLAAYERSAGESPTARGAFEEAKVHEAYLRKWLGMDGAPLPAGLRWVNASGYIDLWYRLHRAEEALIELMPLPDLVARAQWEYDRLRGSTVERREDLLIRLEGITKALTDPDAQKPPPDARYSCQRAQLRKISRSINDFRNGLYEALALSRNRLNRTAIFGGVVAYSLLCLMLLLGAPVSQIASGAVLYLIGAIAGLFGRLASEIQSDHAIEDYGLTCTRLLHAPLFSGLAALGGVALVAMLPGMVQPDGPTLLANSSPTLLDLFANVRLADLAVATVFGLTPALLINQLQSKAERYKAALSKTEAAQAS